jgi:DHA3 family macrolide efflux protein-like MFS transporter
MQTSSLTLPKNWAARFFTIWTGQAFSLLGSGLVQFALVWWLTQKTGSATILATASLVALLPQIVLGPFAGALVDRWNRRLVLIISDAAIAVSTLGLIFLFALGWVQVWHIYVIMFIRSLGGAFQFPTMQASTSLMVPEEQLSRVAGVNQTLEGLVNILAPPAGALLISLLPTERVLSIDILTALLAILPLLFIPIPQPDRQQQPSSGSVKGSGYWQDLREGFVYVAKWPGLLAIMLLATLINLLLSPTNALMPLLVTRHFGGGAFQLGWLESAWGFGVIAGGLILSAWGGFRKKVITSLLGVIGIGFGILLVGLAPSNLFALAVAGYLISGVMNPITNGPLFAALQSIVRADMQGRVMSLLLSAATAMMPLSLLIAGPVSDWLGIRTWYWFGGLACLLVGLAAFFIPVVMNVEENHNEPTSEETSRRTAESIPA